VIPYFGFARQDRKDKPRVSIASKLVANLLAVAGVTRVITLDLHADQIQGFFDVPVDHLYASSIFIPYLKELNLPNLTMASPDTGGTRRAASYAKMLDDIIDTAGSITRAAQLMVDNGATSVRAFCTHPVFSGQAYQRINESPFTEVVVSDTIPMKKKSDKITVLSTSKLFADVIERVESNKSISSLFKIQ
jgi:ribose-phosphate pyrophosphokinase